MQLEDIEFLDLHQPDGTSKEETIECYTKLEASSLKDTDSAAGGIKAPA